MLTVLGDCHGKIKQYINIINKTEDCTLQLGDLAFDYSFAKTMCIDIDRHKYFKGNHDSYDLPDQSIDSGYCIGDYGLHNHGDVEFFFVRGEFSIDYKYRQEHDRVHKTKSWWKEEELSSGQMLRCLHEYTELKPDIVITHGAPSEVVDLISNPSILRKFGFDPDTFITNTQRLLNTMLHVHRPKLWVMGHFHVAFDQVIDGTRFVVLPELGTFTVPETV